MKPRKRKYECPTKEILKVVELFEPIGTVDIVQLAGLTSDYAFACGIIRALEETGMILRDEETGLYWYDNGKY